MISFSTGKLRKKCSGQIRSFFSSNCSNWEKYWKIFVKQIGENIWWIHYLSKFRRANIDLTFVKSKECRKYKLKTQKSRPYWFRYVISKWQTLNFFDCKEKSIPVSVSERISTVNAYESPNDFTKNLDFLFN